MEEYACKCIPENDKLACCLPNLYSFSIVDYVNTCKCVTQVCCFESICGCPLDEAYVTPTAIDTANYGEADPNYIYPCYCCCCCGCGGGLDSIYTKWPNLLGISTNSTCCCSYTSNVCLKPMCGDEANPKKNLQLICVRNRFMCVKPTSCCDDQSQFLCIDHRCTCPWTPDVPCSCIFPLTFFTCCVNWTWVGGCLLNLAQLRQINEEIKRKTFTGVKAI
jgi:hypothetical protein